MLGAARLCALTAPAHNHNATHTHHYSNGKRTGVAALRVAIEMEKEGLITPQEAVLMVEVSFLSVDSCQPPSPASHVLAPSRGPRLPSFVMSEYNSQTSRCDLT